MFFILKGTLNCQKPKRVIEYRFVPRTFEENSNEPVDLYSSFKNIFEEQNMLPGS